jgi:hypothetical protein
MWSGDGRATRRGRRHRLSRLWFLYYLLIFYALALGYALVRRRRRGAIAAACDRIVALIVRGVWVV